MLVLCPTIRFYSLLKVTGPQRLTNGHMLAKAGGGEDGSYNCTRKTVSTEREDLVVEFSSAVDIDLQIGLLERPTSIKLG